MGDRQIADPKRGTRTSGWSSLLYTTVRNSSRPREKGTACRMRWVQAKKVHN